MTVTASLTSLWQIMIFGVMKIVNFAHGDFVMLAMYVAFFLSVFTGVDPFVLIPLAAVLFFFVGVVVYRLFFSRLIGGPDFPQLIVSLGLSLLLQSGNDQLVQLRQRPVAAQQLWVV